MYAGMVGEYMIRGGDSEDIRDRANGNKPAVMPEEVPIVIQGTQTSRLTVNPFPCYPCSILLSASSTRMRSTQY